MPTDALSVLCVQLTRDLLAIAKFLFVQTQVLGAPDSRKRLLENSVFFKIQPQISSKSLLFHTPFYILFTQSSWENANAATIFTIFFGKDTSLLHTTC